MSTPASLARCAAPEYVDPVWATAGAQVVGIVLAVLAGYGGGDDAAPHATRALHSPLAWLCLLAATGGFGLPLNLDESFRRLLAGNVAGLRTVHT